MEFDKYLQSLDKNEKIENIAEMTKKNAYSSSIEIPKYLSHCTSHLSKESSAKNIVSIVENGVLGKINKKNENYTYFSPIPMYDACLVFKTENISGNKPVPTYYCNEEFVDKKGQYCVIFNDKGWQKIDPKALPKKIDPASEENMDQMTFNDDYRITNKYIREKEWRIKNPILFNANDIEAITFYKCSDARNFVNTLRDDVARQLKDKIYKFEKSSIRVEEHFYKAVIPHLEKCNIEK